MNFIVICLTHPAEGADVAGYTLATRQTFATRDAADRYAAGVASSRHAIGVEGRFSELRVPEDRS